MFNKVDPRKKTCLSSDFKRVSVFLVFFFLFFFSSYSATYYSKASGNWDTPSTWGTGCGGGEDQTPAAGDNVEVCSGYTVTVTAAASITNITINSGGVLRFTNNFTLTVSGATIVASGGSFIMTTGIFLTSNNFTLNGTSSISGGTIRFSGSGLQQIDGTATSQTLYNIDVSKSGGALTVAGSTTALTINNLTFSATNTGSFTAPITLNLTQSTTASITFTSGNTGTFTAGSLITINANWTNNCGESYFVPNAGSVKFVNGAVALINGTATTQTFYDLEIAKTAQSLVVSGSTTTLNVNNFTQTSFLFNVSGASTLFSVSGDFLHTSGTFTPSNTITIAGNLTDNNVAGLTWGTTVTLSGTTVQTIGGSRSMTFTNLVINNTSSTGITLQKPTYINGALTLTDGYVYTDATNLLVINNGASSTSGSAVSFVSGPMKKKGASAFVFPVGSAGTQNVWARLGMENTINASAQTEYVCRYYFTGAPYNSAEYMPVTLKHVSYHEYWDLEQTYDPRGDGNCYVRLYWESATRSGINTTDRLYVAHFMSGAGSYENLRGTVTNGSSGSILAASNSTGFSPFTFASDIASTSSITPLPIELLSFNAEVNGTVVDLYWATASETNNDFFSIEKTTDGINFEVVGTVKGAGNSSEILNYTFIDADPYTKVSYYRLKQTDYDGHVSYSNLVAVNFEKQTDLSVAVYPNPGDGSRFSLIMNSDRSEEVLTLVQDMYGNTVHSKVIAVSHNSETIYQLDFSKKLIPGVYTITFYSNNGTHSKRLIVN